MNYQDNRKYKRCACGADLPIFGRKCDTCLKKEQRKIYYRKYKDRVYGIKKPNACCFCGLDLSGELVVFSGGTGHKPCWRKEVFG